MKRVPYHKIYLSAWWLCVVTMPWFILPGSISIGLLFIVWLSDPELHEKWIRLKNNQWMWPFMVFFLLHIVGTFYSEDLESAWFQIESKLALAAVPIVAATGWPLERKTFPFFKKGFIVSCFTVTVISLMYAGAAFSDSSGPALNFDPYSTAQFNTLFQGTHFWEYFSYIQLSKWVDIHPAFFSMYLIFCILVLLQGMIDRQRGSVFEIAIIVWFVLFISLLSSRMAVLSLVASVCLIVVSNLYKLGRVPQSAIVVPGLLLVLLLTIWINPVARYHIWIEPATAELTADNRTDHWNSINLRLLSWKASADIGLNHWLTGVGTGDGQQSLHGYYSGLGLIGFTANSHNQYLQTFIELGISGLLVMLICIFGPAVSAFKHKPLHFSFIILFGLMCFSESMLARPKGISFFIIFQSLFLATKNTTDGQ